MRNSRAAIFIVSTGCILCSCGPEAPANSTAAANPTLQPSPRSDSVRESFNTLGIKLPELGTVLSRKGKEVLGFPVNSNDSITMWKSLRALTEKTGWYPLVTRELNWEDRADETKDRDPEEVIRAADKIDLDPWFKARLADVSLPEASDGEPEAMKHFTVPFDTLTGKPIPGGVMMLLVPTTRGHEVPAYVPFGDWNDCPDDATHIAVLKRWNERYGAELVTMMGDILELQVAKPPTTQDASHILALEQAAYCSDIVDQGVGSIGALAKTLKGESIWFFWWD